MGCREAAFGVADIDLLDMLAIEAGIV